MFGIHNMIHVFICMTFLIFCWCHPRGKRLIFSGTNQCLIVVVAEDNMRKALSAKWLICSADALLRWRRHLYASNSWLVGMLCCFEADYLEWCKSTSYWEKTNNKSLLSTQYANVYTYFLLFIFTITKTLIIFHITFILIAKISCEHDWWVCFEFN